MKIVIIEDEPLMANALRENLEQLDEPIEVVASLDSVRGALHYFTEHPLPDLFFSDIQLPDGLSFEIFRQLDAMVPVIFCTAYDQYALEAFQQNGVDYLLKPFDLSDLRKTVAKYKRLTQSPSPGSFDPEALMSYFGLPQTSARNKSLLVHQGEKIIPLKQEHIALVYKKDGITYAFTFHRKKYVLDQSLDDLEQVLGATFFRANRQFLIQRESIQEVVRYFARKLVLRLHIEFPEQIIISKAKAPAFLSWLQDQ